MTPTPMYLLKACRRTFGGVQTFAEPTDAAVFTSLDLVDAFVRARWDGTRTGPRLEYVYRVKRASDGLWHVIREADGCVMFEYYATSLPVDPDGRG